jgi:hypothetical protein
MTLRIAFPSESDGILEIDETDLEAQVNNDLSSFSKREAFRNAEYVPIDSLYKTWAEIRHHGYTAKAYVSWKLR